MERKNMVLLTVIAVATLLVAVVGATFAYFSTTVTDNRDTDDKNGKANVSSAQVATALTFATTSTGAGSFEAIDVYPGHKEIAEIKVTASGTEGSKAGIRFKYTVTENEFPEQAIKVSLYKKETTGLTIQDGVNFFGCTQTSAPDGDGGNMKLYETCQSDETALTSKSANLVAGSKQDVPTSAESIELARDVITVGADDTNVYYYVVLEFVNKESDDQTTEAGNKHLKGKIEVTAA